MVGLSKLFLDQEDHNIETEDVVNQFDFNYSFNFDFDDDDRTDVSASSDVSVSSGKLLSSTTSGFFISVVRNTLVPVSKFQVLAIGEKLDTCIFKVSTDNGNTWVVVTLRELYSVAGMSSLRLMVEFSDVAARVDAAVVLYS